MAALRGLGVHLGGSSATDETTLPSMHTSAGTVWFAYGPGIVADGSRRRITPSVFYYHAGFGGFVEYVRSTQRVAGDGTSSDVSNHAWNATASLMLTGESASEGAVHPNRPLDATSGGWGAWQIAARYATVEIDRDAFARGLAVPAAVGRAREYSLGLNWFPVAVVKYYAMFEHTSFSEGSGARPSENLVILRAQLAF
jgi:phosphate-selective porin OprO/OprP